MVKPKLQITKLAGRWSIAGVLLCALGLLSACVGDGVRVDLEGAGPFVNDVASCLQLASNSGLRADVGAVNQVAVRVTSAEQVIDSEIRYLVTGETTVKTRITATYEWECESHTSAESRTLVAELTRFELVG